MLVHASQSPESVPGLKAKSTCSLGPTAEEVKVRNSAFLAIFRLFSYILSIDKLFEVRLLSVNVESCIGTINALCARFAYVDSLFRNQASLSPA